MMEFRSPKFRSKIADNRQLDEPRETLMDLEDKSASRPRLSQKETKLEVVVATDSGGWSTTTNRVLALCLARNDKLRVRAFIPRKAWKRSEIALNIELLEDKNLPGYSPRELLDYPPDKLHHIDFLIMHCYERELAKQAEEICETKKCKFIPVMHIDWGEFVKFFNEFGVSVDGHDADHQAERQRQIELCQKAEFVVTIGPKVAESLANTLQSCGKDTHITSITPGIFSELIGIRQIHEEQVTFNVLIHAEYLLFFNIKGCDIAVKAILALNDPCYHLTIAMNPNGELSELKQTLLREGMRPNQFSVVSARGDAPESLAEFIGVADALILPSRVEGFGMSGIYAISADLPVLVSGNSGLGMALKMLPDGLKYVVDSDDPLIWAQKIKEIRTMGQENASLEAVQLRKEYMSKFSWQDQCNELVEKMMIKSAPAEILARGPLAIEAYNKAMEQGFTRVMRVPIMFIGQELSGKTSLKKSLRGQLFNDKEECTDGIERDPSYFSVSTEIWSTGEANLVPDSDFPVSLHNRVAQFMVADLRGEVVDLESSHETSVRNIVSSNSTKSADSDIYVLAEKHVGEQTQEKLENPESAIGNLLPKISEEESKEETFKQEVPHTTAECVQKLLQESKRKDDDKVYSILWDFGGQSVYYATHPIFLTAKAIYLLAYDLSKLPHDRATPIVKEGAFKQKEDRHCRKTNEDYLHFWLSSVSSLASHHMSHSKSVGSGKLPKKLPPVILVCTHADKCADKELAREIYGSLRCETKPYGDHLSKTYFVVDNTKSGSADECPDVQRLRNEVLAVAKQLPQMKQSIPIKWLSFEEALKYKIEKGEPFISLDEARRVAYEECGIDDDQQFDTLLNFLHDQRILIHFDDTNLKNMVILDPQWLIDLFRKVITVKRYDPTADEEQCEELWRKLETEGILVDELLQIVWGPLLNKETTENLIAVMEKFSLLCHLPSMDKQKQYLVPSMLMSHPYEVATRLLAAEFIPPLFLRFRQPHPLGYPCDASDVTFVPEHLQVPLGLFPRLVVKFLQWCIKDGFRPLYKQMYQNLARFPIHPKGYSVILLCHSSSIEIVVHKDPGTTSDTSDVTIGYKVRRQLGSMLQRMREECFWLNSMEYEFSVICPVCCEQRSVRYCHKHDTSGCDKEKCLHFWSESELQEEQFCCRDTFAEHTAVPVREFVPWFEFLKMKEQAVDEFVHSFGDSLVKDMIVTNVHVMDELACGLDQPICHGKQELPITQYWVHLAAEFHVPEEVVIKCQHNSESSPSKHMLEFKEGHEPNFSVRNLKDGLEGISRNDLVKTLEQCSLPDTATLTDLRAHHPETLESICLQLDHYKNWQALGQKIGIPNETLQNIGTSSSCTKTVLEIIQKRNPKLTKNEMRVVLTEMRREDVSNVLDKYLRDENGTIATLRENQDCLEEITILLDKETPGMENWLHFARKFGISKDDCDYLRPKGDPSPTKTLMEYIVQVDPDLTVMQFIQTLMKMQRSDVVNALKKYFCGNMSFNYSVCIKVLQPLNKGSTRDFNYMEEGFKNLWDEKLDTRTL